MVIFLALLVGFVVISYAYMRRQWLQYLRQQSLAEVSEFVAKSQEFDTVVAGALTLVQEVELVSRGYRMYGLLTSGDLALLT
jgi:CHASE3 domain sensor protein